MRPVHHMVHQADRPDGGVEWGCPRCGRYMVFYPMRHVIVRMGRAGIVHLSGNGFPQGPGDVPLLSELDHRWLQRAGIAW